MYLINRRALRESRSLSLTNLQSQLSLGYLTYSWDNDGLQPTPQCRRPDPRRGRPRGARGGGRGVHWAPHTPRVGPRLRAWHPQGRGPPRRAGNRQPPSGRTGQALQPESQAPGGSIRRGVASPAAATGRAPHQDRHGLGGCARTRIPLWFRRSGGRGPGSDLDLFVVRKTSSAGSQDSTWEEQLVDLESEATTWTGNEARILEYRRQDLSDPAIRELAEEVVADGIAIFGTTSQLRKMISGPKS